MNKLLKIDFPKRKAPSSLLGLALDGSRLEGVVLRRTNGSLQVNQRFAVTLSLDPLTNDAELVGREILNHLEAAGVRERRCVVALPLKWTLSTHTRVPQLPEADVASFLQIEAERGFPTDVTALQVATSRLASGPDGQHALFVGVPRNHVERLERVLRAARLKPVSFSLGITALQPAGEEPNAGVLALVLGEHPAAAASSPCARSKSPRERRATSRRCRAT
jgi:Tfp pilus assembly PilM family ATPase